MEAAVEKMARSEAEALKKVPETKAKKEGYKMEAAVQKTILDGAESLRKTIEAKMKKADPKAEKVAKKTEKKAAEAKAEAKVREKKAEEKKAEAKIRTRDVAARLGTTPFLFRKYLRSTEKYDDRRYTKYGWASWDDPELVKLMEGFAGKKAAKAS